MRQANKVGYEKVKGHRNSQAICHSNQDNFISQEQLEGKMASKD